jgi:hypothetical protein
MKLVVCFRARGACRLGRCLFGLPSSTSCGRCFPAWSVALPLFSRLGGAAPFGCLLLAVVRCWRLFGRRQRFSGWPRLRPRSRPARGLAHGARLGQAFRELVRDFPHLPNMVASGPSLACQVIDPWFAHDYYPRYSTCHWQTATSAGRGNKGAF